MLVALATSTGLAVAATPVSGSISGQVTSVKGSSFVVKDAFGPVADSTVSVTGSSTIIEQVTASSSDLKVGVCVAAIGEKASSGAVTATRITISAAVKGACSSGFFGRGGGGPRPGDTPPSGGGAGAGGRPGFTPGSFGNFGFASGLVSALKGSTLTVHGTTGSTTVTVSSKTQLLEMEKVASSAITVNECANVRGTSSNDGLTVAATSVNLSKPTSSGCNRGFGGGGSPAPA